MNTNTSKLIRLSPAALALVEEYPKGQQSEAINAAIIAQLGQGKEQAIAKLKVLLTVVENEE